MLINKKNIKNSSLHLKTSKDDCVSLANEIRDSFHCKMKRLTTLYNNRYSMFSYFCILYFLHFSCFLYFLLFFISKYQLLSM